MLTSNKPLKWLKNKKYIGSFLADEDFFKCLEWTMITEKGFTKAVPVRPEKYYNVWNRIIQSKDVLFGNADALYWRENVNDC